MVPFLTDFPLAFDSLPPVPKTTLFLLRPFGGHSHPQHFLVYFDLADLFLLQQTLPFLNYSHLWFLDLKQFLLVPFLTDPYGEHLPQFHYFQSSVLVTYPCLPDLLLKYLHFQRLYFLLANSLVLLFSLGQMAEKNSLTRPA